MSHFTVMVIGAEPEDQLAPFDEQLETPRYVSYTKDQLIEKEKKSIEDYKNGLYADFLADPERYRAKCVSNPAHINYLENEFPKKLSWDDEEIYQEAIKWYESEDIGENGEVYSTCNPNSKWDWFVLGGRWSGSIKLKEGATGEMGESGTGGNETGIDQAMKGDIANLDELSTFAVLKDGEWFERGEMGWWGIAHNKKDEELWKSELNKLVHDLPDETLISIYDCHI